MDYSFSGLLSSNESGRFYEGSIDGSWFRFELYSDGLVAWVNDRTYQDRDAFCAIASLVVLNASKKGVMWDTFAGVCHTCLCLAFANAIISDDEDELERVSAFMYDGMTDSKTVEVATRALGIAISDADDEIARRALPTVVGGL